MQIRKKKAEKRSTGIYSIIARYRFHAVVLFHGNNSDARNLIEGGTHYS